MKISFHHNNSNKNQINAKEKQLSKLEEDFGILQ
jgi:hypothetical protein